MSDSEFSSVEIVHRNGGYDLLVDGKSVRSEAWLAALDAVERAMPSEAFSDGLDEFDEGRAVGWNRCLSTMSERIADLREGVK